MSNIADSDSLRETPKPLTDVEDATSIKSASPAATVTSNGLKRKRTTEPKFYAVRVGFTPGIYHSWADCLKQVKGFKQATCQYSRTPEQLQANTMDSQVFCHSDRR